MTQIFPMIEKSTTDQLLTESKKSICQKLEGKGNAGFMFFSKKKQTWFAVTRKLKRLIFQSPELVEKLGWKSETDFIKQGRKDFSIEQSKHLREYFKL